MAATSVARAPVEMTVRGPLPVVLEDINNDGNTASAGCYILDLVFPQPVQVAEIFFHNFYTAWITVLVRAQPCSDSDLSGSGGSAVCSVMSNSAGREAQWHMAIWRRNLMPNPHLESGSHDFVSILATESSIPWTDLIGIRLLLRQPSPSWITFHIEEIRVFSELPRRRRNTDFQLNLSSTSSRPESETFLLSLRRSTLSTLRVALPGMQQQQQQPPQTSASTSVPAAASNFPKPRLREMAALYEIANLLPT